MTEFDHHQRTRRSVLAAERVHRGEHPRPGGIPSPAGERNTPVPRALRRAQRQRVREVRRATRVGRSGRQLVLSWLTMAFVAAVVLVTSIPVDSLLTRQDIAMANAPALTRNELPAQSLIVASGGADVPINRDDYSVTSMRELLLETAGNRTGSFSNDSNAAIQWPFAIGVPTTDQFGPRVLCDGCEVTQHQGVDFTPGRGAPIQIIADGVVRYVEESDDGLGVHVIVDHQIGGQLVSSVYCHMNFGSVRVSEGESVRVGQIVGTVGETGFAFGPHLHFEIRLGGTDNVDPFAWLQEHAG